MTLKPRDEDVTFLLTFANRFTDSEQQRGLPKGFLLLCAEGDGTFTHHISDPDRETDWIAMIGNLEVSKMSIMQTKLDWQPVHPDGTEMSDDEIREFFQDADDEED